MQTMGRCVSPKIRVRKHTGAVKEVSEKGGDEEVGTEACGRLSGPVLVELGEAAAEVEEGG